MHNGPAPRGGIPPALVEKVADAAVSLLGFAVGNFTSRPAPHFATSPWGGSDGAREASQVAVQPARNPGDLYRPLAGCPWCRIAEAVGAANVHIVRAIRSDARVGAQHVEHARQILIKLRSDIKATGGEVEPFATAIDRAIFPMLQSPQGAQLKGITDTLSGLIDLAMDGAERPHPMLDGARQVAPTGTVASPVQITGGANGPTPDARANPPS